MVEPNVKIEGNVELTEEGESLESIALDVWEKLQMKTKHIIESVVISFTVNKDENQTD